MRWRNQIRIIIYKNPPSKEARESLITQFVSKEAKVIYDNHNDTTEIDNDATFTGFAFQSDTSYLLFKASGRYIEGKQQSALVTTWNFVFGTGSLGNFAYTLQKRYIRDFKFQLGHAMTIKDY